MALTRSGSLHRKFLLSLLSQPTRCCATAEQTDRKISIPNRIERGPTDILKALASTAKKDYTAPHYKYMDDPFLIPQSNVNRRAYALSRESGRKAARYFMDNYPHFFYRDDAEPKIPAFSYKDTFRPETAVDESDLVACIACRQVLNAIQIYKNCRDQKVELSPETKQSLLELLCFYNSQDGPDSEFLEQQWFKSNDQGSDKKKTWLDDSLAEEIFVSMPEKSEEAINAMICGYSRFNASEKALKLFEDATRNNVRLDVETYNYILKMTTFSRQSGDSRWEMILEILRDMRHTETSPNLGTFNEILCILSRQQTWRHAKNMALKITGEMHCLGIEPSLATFHFLLCVHSYDKTGGATPEILYEIMTYLSGKSLQIRHPKDVLFFMNAMSVCRESLSDVDLAYKIHDLLCTGENNKLIGDSFRESVYYQNFVKLLATSESMEGLMEFYEKYVPNTYVPEPDVMEKIIEAAAFHEAYDHISALWSDVISFDYSTRDSIVQAMINAMANADVKNEKISERFVTITEDLMDRFDKMLTTDKVVTRAWSADNLSGILKIFVNCSRLDLGRRVIDKLAEKQNEISGFADAKVLQSFCQKAIEMGSTDDLLRCLKYAADVGNDFVISSVSESMGQISPDDPNKRKIELLVGSFKQ